MHEARGPRPGGRPRVAVLYATDEGVDGGGSDRRVAALLAGLKEIADLQVINPGAGSHRPHGWARIRAAAAGVPPRISQQYQPGRNLEVRRRLQHADVILAATVFSLPYVPRSLRTRTILDAHNVESLVVSQLAATDPSRWRRFAYRATVRWTERWEKAVVRDLGQVWAVSENEAEWFSQAGARAVVVVPNGVDIDVPPAAADAREVVFVASFGSTFNRQALGWFLERVWPSIRAMRPATVLTLVGRGSEQFNGPGVTARGFVPEIHDAYRTARVAIAPLISGAGTRLKVLESLAHRVPVVSTHRGAEGLDLRADEDYFLADDPEDFARACLRLLTDDGLHERMASRGAASVAGRYSWPASCEQAAGALLALSGRLAKT